MRHWILFCLLLVACAPQSVPQDIPEPTVPPLLQPPDVRLPDSAPVWQNTPAPEPVKVEQPVEGETVEEFVEDKAECWKDSDCGQDCASNYIMNVYKCDLKRHACVPGYKQPYSTIQCEQEFGYGFRCRVGRCVRGS